ncbi:MAG: hypothetical protein R3E31_05555 [Chloroflexota bacterium]
MLPVEPLTHAISTPMALSLVPDLAQMTAQIAQLDERDVEGYLAYLAYARIHPHRPVFIYDQPPTPRSTCHA